MSRKKQKSVLPFIAALLAHICIGTNSTLLKIGTESIEPLLFSGLRYAAIAAVLFLFVRNFRALSSWNIASKLLLNTLLVLGFTVFHSIGVDESTAIKSSVLSLVNPVMVYLFSLFILHERLLKQPLVGGLIALAGSLLVVGLPTLIGQPARIGDIYLLIGYTLLALSIIHTKYLYQWLKVHEILSFRMGLAGLVLLAYSVGQHGAVPLQTVTPRAWTALAISTVFGGIVGLSLLYWSLKRMDAEQSAPLFYADPLAGTLAASLLLNEKLSTLALLGVGVIIIGLFVVYPHHVRVLHKLHVPQPPRLFARLRSIFG